MATDLAAQDFYYLTTTGRRTGRAHRIEIWFALEGSTIYMLAGDRTRSDWVANLIATPATQVQIADRTFDGVGRIVEDATEEDARARRLVVEKYAPGYEGDLLGWRDEALPVAVDLDLAVDIDIDR